MATLTLPRGETAQKLGRVAAVPILGVLHHQYIIREMPLAIEHQWGRLGPLRHSLRLLSKYTATYGPCFGLLLLPALVNGFPLVFSDSGTYLRTAIEFSYPVDRPFYYSFFVRILHWQLTLWPIILVQAVLLIAVFTIFFRHCLGKLPSVHLSILLFLFASLTSVPVIVCQVMPDIFTPLLIVCLCTLVFFGSTLSTRERYFVCAITLMSVCFHQANFLIGAITLVASWACRLLFARRLVPATSFITPIVLLVMGFALLVTPNYVLFHQIVVTRGQGVMLLAKLIDDGVAFDYLEAVCPTKHYSICSQMENIRQYNDTASPEQKIENETFEYVIWGPPLQNAGGWKAVASYAGTVSFESIKRKPGTFATASIRGFGAQLTTFKTGDGVKRYDQATSIWTAIHRHFPVNVSRSFETSLQETTGLNVKRLSFYHQLIVVSSLVMLLFLFVFLAGIDQMLVAVALTLLASVVGNAFVIGVLSSLHDRYQSRVVCLVVLAALLLSYRWAVSPRAGHYGLSPKKLWVG